MPMYTRMIGCTVTAVALALLGSPVASADDDSFVRDTKAIGFQQSSVNLVSTGQSACNFLRLNRDPAQVTDRIGRFLSVSSDLARQFLVLSINEYCPQRGAQIVG